MLYHFLRYWILLSLPLTWESGQHQVPWPVEADNEPAHWDTATTSLTAAANLLPSACGQHSTTTPQPCYLQKCLTWKDTTGGSGNNWNNWMLSMSSMWEFHTYTHSLIYSFICSFIYLSRAFLGLLTCGRTCAPLRKHRCSPPKHVQLLPGGGWKSLQ